MGKNKGIKWLMAGILILLAGFVGGCAIYSAEASAFPKPTGNGNAIYSEGMQTNLGIVNGYLEVSGNYYARIKAAQYTKNAEGNQYTAAGFNLSACDVNPYIALCNDSVGVTVGILTTKNEVRWYVYGAPRIKCHRGANAFEGYGCLGNNKDIVRVKSWHGFRFIKQDTGWDIIVESATRQPYKVASIETEAYWLTGAGVSYLENEPLEFTNGGDPVNPVLLGGFWVEMPYFKASDNRMKKWPNGATVRWGAASICPDEHGLKDQISHRGGKWYMGHGGKGLLCGAESYDGVIEHQLF